MRDELARRAEGVVADRVIGTYLHGPALARNPASATGQGVFVTARWKHTDAFGSTTLVNRR